MEASSDSKVEENPVFLTPIIVFFRELSFSAKSGDRKVLSAKQEAGAFPFLFQSSQYQNHCFLQWGDA